MKTTKNYKFWFATGSQDLYGDECLQKVAEHSKIIVNELNKSGILPYEVVWKPTLITNEVIRKTFNDANADEECAGVITWMHTFPCKILDPGTAGIPKTTVTSAYSVQRRDSVRYYRHGFYE